MASKKQTGVMMVRTKSAVSFRRCGMSFGKEPTPVALADLKEGQVDMLMNEPQLICEASDEKKAD